MLCGYQGWFRCPGDSADEGWRHWSRSGRNIGQNTLSFEMWPDMSEYGDDEKYAAPGFSNPDGKAAHLFSSVNPKTVDRHFQWMREYGIDGVFLQRFLVELNDRSIDQVLANVRKSAARTGRTYALCYDLSGASKAKMFDILTNDWKRLVDVEKITQDDRYLHHNKKPVLFVWGFFKNRFEASTANQIIDFFKSDPKYGVTLIGGCQWWWRTEADPEWSKVFRRFDVLSPWNVGNTAMIENQKHASTAYWKADLEEARKAGMEYLPVIYPGFSWTNLKGKQAAKNEIPRWGAIFFGDSFRSPPTLESTWPRSRCSTR